MLRITLTCGFKVCPVTRHAGSRERAKVKSFILAIAAMIGIAYGAAMLLEGYQKTADGAFVGYGAKPDPEPALRGVATKH